MNKENRNTMDRLHRERLKQQAAGLTMLERFPLILAVFTVAAIALDSINLYFLFDYYVSESVYLLYAMTVGFATLQDASPLLLAMLLQAELPQESRFHALRRTAVICVGLVFLLLSGTIFYLRIVSCDMMFAGEAVEPAIAYGLAVLLGLEPLFTGVLLFAASFRFRPDLIQRYQWTKIRNVIERTRLELIEGGPGSESANQHSNAVSEKNEDDDNVIGWIGS